jgi:hypothetical protein
MSDSIVTYDPATGQPILRRLRGSKPRRSAPSLPDEAMSRDEVAVLFGTVPDDAEGVLMSRGSAVGMHCRSAEFGGDRVFHRGDAEAIRRAKPRPRRSSPPRPRPARSRERFEFTDPGTPSSPGVPAVSLANAAERYGMSEDELTTRVLGRAKLEVVDGKMLVRKSDLDRMSEEGTLPDPRKLAKVERMTAEVEGRSIETSNPAVQRRTEAVAAAIGIELNAPSKPRDDDQEQDQGRRRVPGIATVRADDRKPYRLGAPRRWGER